MTRARLLGLAVATAMVGTSVVGIASLTGVPVSAAETPPPCVVTLSANPVAVGENLTITITGFDPDESINVAETIDGVPQSAYSLTADDTGTYTNSGVTPADEAGLNYTFTFTGASSGVTCNTALSVDPEATTTTTTPTTTQAPTTTAPPTTSKVAAAVAAEPAFTG